MKTITLDGPTVDRLIEAAVQDRGEDFVYSAAYPGIECIYYVTEAYAAEVKDEHDIVLPTGPACMVGKIFHDLDPALDDVLLSGNTEAVSGLFGLYGGYEFNDDIMNLDSLPPILEVKGRDVEVIVDALAFAKLSTCQRAQDYGDTWGRARDRAKAVGA